MLQLALVLVAAKVIAIQLGMLAGRLIKISLAKMALPAGLHLAARGLGAHGGQLRGFYALRLLCGNVNNVCHPSTPFECETPACAPQCMRVV